MAPHSVYVKRIIAIKNINKLTKLQFSKNHLDKDNLDVKMIQCWQSKLFLIYLDI